MKLIIQLNKKSEVGARCHECGVPLRLRLIGIESDPVLAGTDLLTYCCSACGEFFVHSSAGLNNGVTQY